MALKSILIPTPPNYFFSKNDPDDQRLGEIAKPALLQSAKLKRNDFSIVGYPDDEGIRLSGGRVGAADAPKLIRQFLYKMTPAVLSNKNLSIFDFGDLQCTSDLATRHQDALAMTTYLHQQQSRVISFGGGHDYGYADAAGFLANYAGGKQKPMVINFDAHLDVRSTANGLSSGTPFFRVLNEFKGSFDFIEIGLQSQCNSKSHWDWAKKQGALLYDLKTVEQRGMKNILSDSVFKNLTPDTPLFVSFDIDALSAFEAGGCSQAWVTGLKTQECLQFLSSLYQMADVRGLGIYEVSPPLDRDFQTSKTAALIAHHFLFETLN